MTENKLKDLLGIGRRAWEIIQRQEDISGSNTHVHCLDCADGSVSIYIWKTQISAVYCGPPIIQQEMTLKVLQYVLEKEKNECHEGKWFAFGLIFKLHIEQVKLALTCTWWGSVVFKCRCSSLHSDTMVRLRGTTLILDIFLSSVWGVFKNLPNTCDLKKMHGFQKFFTPK